VPPDAVSAVHRRRGGAGWGLDAVDVVEPVQARGAAAEPVDRLHEAAAIAGLHPEAALQHSHHRLRARDPPLGDTAELPRPEAAGDGHADLACALAWAQPAPRRPE